jgi:hypothetical protein
LHFVTVLLNCSIVPGATLFFSFAVGAANK